MTSWGALSLAFALLSLRGACSNDCPGTEDYLNAQNIDRFSRCTHVRGNLVINEQSLSNFSTASVFYKKLYNLINVSEIDGYLVIEKLNHSHLTNLRFLRNLERIRGMETVLLFGVQKYTLVVQNNPHLLTLNLASLKSIENGGLRILDNPQLCLVDSISIENYLVNSTLSRTGGLGYICSVVCHGECVEEHGCWGTLPDECVMCRGFKFFRTCVETCNLSISTPDHNLNICIPNTFQKTPYARNPIYTTISTEFSLDRTTRAFDSDLSSAELTLQTDREKYSIWYIVPSVIIALAIVMTIIATVSSIYWKKKKSKKITLTQQKKNSSLCGTPEKYSRHENDKTILVSSCGGENSTKMISRSPNVSISSLATASIHSNDRKNGFINRTTPVTSPQPGTSSCDDTIPLASTMTLTRRNSPIEQIQSSIRSSASSYAPSNGDTGYSSNSTSRKPSLVGSRASSTSLRHTPAMTTITGGNVYRTGQHQLHPHRQSYHQQHGLHNQRSKGSLTSQMNTGIMNNAEKPTNGDGINISVLASNSGYFEPQS